MELDRKLLGRGKYGKVLEVEDEDGRKIALKIVSPSNFSLIELDILSRMKSPYLIRSVGSIKYIPGEGEGMPIQLKENNLSKFHVSLLKPGQLKRIIISLLLGVECLHKKGFLHLDIKPSNCLYDVVDGNYTGYISDFGHALRCRDVYVGVERNTRAGSLKYFPYENLEKKEKYTFNDKSDIWSTGVAILVFLGLNYKFPFKFGDKTETKIMQIKKFWDENSIERIIHFNVNSLKISEEDKIDLIEMLIHMLKKDINERISSKDFKELNFYKKNLIENSCILSKPKEILYIPYSSSNVLKGIRSLNNFFKTKYSKCSIDTYFLCIEIFIRLMTVSPLEISNQTLEEIIQSSFIGSLRYYKETVLQIKNIDLYSETGYKISKLLDGDIAPNRFFYKAEYADDLFLLKELVFNNYHLISMYSYLNIDKLFEYFRQNYEYSRKKVSDIKTFYELNNMTEPEKNRESFIENSRDIFSSKDLETKTKLFTEDVSYIKKMKKIEEVFNKKIENRMSEKGFKSNINQMKGDVFKHYQNSIIDKNIEIVSTMISQNILKILYITEDIFDKIYTSGDVYSNYFIFKNMDEKFSLAFKNDVDRKIIHYSSKFSKNIHDFCKDKFPGYSYTVDYENGTENICKITEICLLFMIFFNQELGSSDYKSLFITDDTLKNVILFCTLVNPSN